MSAAQTLQTRNWVPHWRQDVSPSCQGSEQRGQNVAGIGLKHANGRAEGASRCSPHGLPIY
jgi:hypothetical protein